MTWTNDAAVQQWNSGSARASMEATAERGDFANQHLLNPVLLRLLGDVRGRRVLDAGCGNGYFSRMLAGRGAEVTGIEPAESLISFAREKSTEVSYVRAELARLPELEPFDAVVCGMVLTAIPGWKPAMRACVEAVRPGGLFVFAITHSAFEELSGIWRKYGEYRQKEHLAEYEIAGRDASGFHRPISAYLTEVAAPGCRLREVVEPGLDPAVADGIESYLRMPNFLLVSAETACPLSP
ncbi:MULTISPECIES: bifunctional 2-polyprenyl-6-hydroxyphenol methylase/3-demethylubiquinol 3-O-methyltransferase UbiG [Amycolatopsis]|nr:class I SAM-dependent methyltransferase [Amycolatopsis sp. M39]OAP25109.1 Ubiquinone biosynthesis O-methyltransferase [Amycolatopsis sp. M39]